MNLYNEIEPYAAEWLENLIISGSIADGSVDRRSIKDLIAEDLDGVSQFHAFAGIGVWSYALRLAGWPDDVPVWTGSCPCQPFSIAGKGEGISDERHLWPDWVRLIAQCRPSIIFGEQVASPDGRAWLDDVSFDLEILGYEVGRADLCAAGIGAPHIRQRLFFCGLAISEGARLEARGRIQHEQSTSGPIESRATCGVADPDGGNTGTEGLQRSGQHRQQPKNREVSRVVQPNGPGLRENERPLERRDLVHASPKPGPVNGFWSNSEWIPCSDGKARPVEPGTLPLAHGAPKRMGRIRAYGNAIVPWVAATFIASVMDILEEH